MFSQLIPSQGWQSIGDGWGGTRQGKAGKCKYFTVHGAAGQIAKCSGVSFFKGMDFTP